MTPVNATFTIGDRVYLIDALSGISFTRGLGMTPSHNQFDIAYSDGMQLPNIGESGTLIIRDGMAPEGIATFTDQIVDDVDWGNSPDSGRTVKIVVKDTRERSARGSITGSYNIPHKGLGFDDVGEVSGGTLENLDHKRSLKELISLCFDALAVTYDASILPTDQYPAVRWEFDNPASEIDRLLSEYGYSVSLAANNKFVVVRLGELDARHGPFVSDVSNEEESQRFTSTGLSPDTIIKGERIVIEEQTRGLIPVGLDIDGKIKPLAQLSYFVARLQPGTTTPLDFGGFQFILDPDNPEAYVDQNTVAVPTINGELPARTLERVKDAATASIWKWYRLPDEHLYKLPVLSNIAKTRTDPITGKVARREPIVVADSYVEEHIDRDTGQPVRAGNSGDVEITEGYSIDTTQGVVKFHSPRVKLVVGTALAVEAFVTLTWAWKSVRLIATDANNQPLPAAQWLPQVAADDFYFYPKNALLRNCKKIEHRELILYRRREFNEDDEPVDTDLNLTELDTFATDLIAKHLWSAQPVVEAASATVPRIVDYECDGLVRQLTWSVSGRAGASTTAFANREAADNPDPIFEERLKSQRVNALLRNEDRFGFSEGASAGGDIVRPGPENAQSKPGGVPIVNRLEDDIPAFSFAQIDESDATDTPKRIRIKRPVPNDSASSRGMLVTLKPVPANGGTARAAHDGFVLVRCTEATAIGDSIGPGSDDPFVGAPGMGPYKVLGKPADELAFIQLNTPGVGAALVFVRIASAYGDAMSPLLDGLFVANPMSRDSETGEWTYDPLTEFIVQAQNGASPFIGARVYVQALTSYTPPGREDPISVYTPISGEPFGFLAKVWQTEENSDDFHFEQIDAGEGIEPLTDAVLDVGTAHNNAADGYEAIEGDELERVDLHRDPADVEENSDGITIDCSLPAGGTSAQLTIYRKVLRLTIIGGASAGTQYVDLSGKTLGEVESTINDDITNWGATLVGDSAADAGLLQQLWKHATPATAYVDHRIQTTVRYDTPNDRFYVEIYREPKSTVGCN